MAHHLPRDLGRQLRRHAATDIDAGQFAQLGLVVARQFGGFTREVGLLGVRLGTDGDVLARRHRHGSRRQSGDACDQDACVAGRGRRDADDQAGGGDQSVIGAEHGGAQPADPLDPVRFPMSHGPVLLSDAREDARCMEEARAEERLGPLAAVRRSEPM
ncbi:hypothetical protein D3C87_1554800 [compost metagenome]